MLFVPGVFSEVAVSLAAAASASLGQAAGRSGIVDQRITGFADGGRRSVGFQLRRPLLQAGAAP